MPEEALQIAYEIREAKGKGEKERDTHLNTEFSKMERRDKYMLNVSINFGKFSEGLSYSPQKQCLGN